MRLFTTINRRQRTNLIGAALVGLTLILPRSGFAQDQDPAVPPTPAPTAGAAQDPIAGPIRPADTIQVQVTGEPMLSGSFRVEKDGKILMPRIGQVKVDALMQVQAAARIADAIIKAKLLKAPDVTVAITNRLQTKVVINGAVTRQGEQQIKDNTRLSVILENAGVTDAADLGRVKITRADTDMVVDYKKYRTGASDKEEFNPLLKDGDRIFIYSNPEVVAGGFVRVIGEVKDSTKPQTAITDGTTVGQVLQQLGGVTEYADRNGIYIERSGQRLPVPYDAILKDDRSKDIVLQNGDTVQIPRLEKPKQYTVNGAVLRSSTYPLNAPTTLQEAVATAGGPSSQGRPWELELRRRTASGDFSTTKYNLTNLQEPVEIADGDIIYVPYAKRGGFSFQTAISILSGVYLLQRVLR